MFVGLLELDGLLPVGWKANWDVSSQSLNPPPGPDVKWQI